jgi:hypothetical protein
MRETTIMGSSERRLSSSSFCQSRFAFKGPRGVACRGQKKHRSDWSESTKTGMLNRRHTCVGTRHNLYPLTDDVSYHKCLPEFLKKQKLQVGRILKIRPKRDSDPQPPLNTPDRLSPWCRKATRYHCAIGPVYTIG